MSDENTTLNTEERALRLTSTPGVEYSIVGYTHAGGVDRPLVAYKTNGGNAGAVVVPHMNWRGLFSLGTNPSGGASTTPVEWPGFRTTAWHYTGETQGATKNWMGSLLEGQRDAGGQMYMRNRYYDPATGQFTQTDPIGIAGGLNTYGFAVGDPVTYSDPYGLKVCFKGGEAEVARLKDATSAAVGASIHMDGNCIASVGSTTNPGLRGLRNRLERLVADDSIYSVSISGWSGCDQPDSHFCPNTRVSRVAEFEIGRKFPAKYSLCKLVGAFGAGPKITSSLPSIIAHELLGHAWSHAVATGLTYDDSEGSAIRAENNYHRAQPGGRERCAG